MTDKDKLEIITFLILLVLVFIMGIALGTLSDNTKLEGAEMHQLGKIECRTFSKTQAKCVFVNPNKEE